jgi:hypothetical protein
MFNIAFDLCFPVLITAFFILIRGLANILKSGSPNIQPKMIISVGFITFWFFQCEIVNDLFGTLACVDVKGKKRLLDDLNIICWEGDHMLMVNYLTIPGIIVYIFVMPIIMIWLIKKDSNLIKDYPDKADKTKREQFIIEAYYEKYCFFFIGTRHEETLNEFMIMYRKIILIFSAQYLRVTSDEI